MTIGLVFGLAAGLPFSFWTISRATRRIEWDETTKRAKRA